eukprot:1160111-Pelagomonas_calceolata.AAC.2
MLSVNNWECLRELFAGMGCMLAQHTFPGMFRLLVQGLHQLLPPPMLLDHKTRLLWATTPRAHNLCVSLYIAGGPPRAVCRTASLPVHRGRGTSTAAAAAQRTAHGGW